MSDSNVTRLFRLTAGGELLGSALFCGRSPRGFASGTPPTSRRQCVAPTCLERESPAGEVFEDSAPLLGTRSLFAAPGRR